MKNARRYTITDIAKELGVTRQAVYYWIKKSWVEPRRDYRHYPVFTEQDLLGIKRWQKTLTKEARPVKQKLKATPSRKASTPPAPYTWDEIQKILYK